LEPFYNGMALAKQSNGQRVVVTEDNTVATKVKDPLSEMNERLHSLCVGFWPSFALKLGLEMGLADKDTTGILTKLPPASLQALKAAWLDLGLLTTTVGGDVTLSDFGRQLKAGAPGRDRADYWLGAQMTPWLEASQRFLSPPSQEKRNSFFDTLDRDCVDLVQRTLYTYAQNDWAEVVHHIDFFGVTKLVDIGGGFGFLAKAVRDKFPSIECVVVEKPEVVESYNTYVEIGKFINAGVPLVPGDLFDGTYPHGDIYILSRILHDWSDIDAVKILEHLKDVLPSDATLLVIERLKMQEGSHGLLQLNMLLTTGGTERSEAEFFLLFTKSGWTKKAATVIVHSNCALLALQKTDRTLQFSRFGQ